MNTRFALLLVCVMLYFASTSSAQITTYSFTGAAGNQASTAASGVASGLQSGATVTRGIGITAQTQPNSMNSSGWTTSSSPNTNDYYTFTITPSAGFQVSFTNLQINVQRSSGSGSNDGGPTAGVVRSSLDSYGANIGSSFTIGTSASEVTIDLSGAAFQNLTSAITFRIYGYNAENSDGTFRLQYSNASAPGIQVNGTVAVIPEAQSYVFASLGLSMVGFGYFRSRRQKLAVV